MQLKPIFFEIILAINKGDLTDNEMESIMETITDSLFSICVTLGKLRLFLQILPPSPSTLHYILKFLGNVPIIRSQRGNAAEMVAKKLEKKLRDNVFDSRNNLFHMDAAQVKFRKQHPENFFSINFYSSLVVFHFNVHYS